MEVTFDHAVKMRDLCIPHAREKQWEYDRDPVGFRKDRMTSAFDTLNYWDNKVNELRGIREYPIAPAECFKVPPCSGYEFEEEEENE